MCPQGHFSLHLVTNLKADWWWENISRPHLKVLVTPFILPKFDSQCSWKFHLLQSRKAFCFIFGTLTQLGGAFKENKVHHHVFSNWSYRTSLVFPASSDNVIYPTMLSFDLYWIYLCTRALLGKPNTYECLQQMNSSRFTLSVKQNFVTRRSPISDIVFVVSFVFNMSFFAFTRTGDAFRVFPIHIYGSMEYFFKG